MRTIAYDHSKPINYRTIPIKHILEAMEAEKVAFPKNSGENVVAREWFRHGAGYICRFTFEYGKPGENPSFAIEVFC